jgi:hypothetical protein
MNFFDHSISDNRIVLSSDLWIFAVTVVPLSTVVFALWGLWVYVARAKWLQVVSADLKLSPGQGPDNALDVNHTLSDVLADVSEGPIYCFRG